jgi:hypothetical protein
MPFGHNCQKRPPARQYRRDVQRKRLGARRGHPRRGGDRHRDALADRVRRTESRTGVGDPNRRPRREPQPIGQGAVIEEAPDVHNEMRISTGNASIDGIPLPHRAEPRRILTMADCEPETQCPSRADCLKPSSDVIFPATARGQPPGSVTCTDHWRPCAAPVSEIQGLFFSPLPRLGLSHLTCA